jgi:hypothetical protein
LGGETAEIVARDVAYIERLAGEYGESVYKNNPEFGVLHYIKELFGEEGLKVFAGTVFSHEGSYWRVRKDGGLDDDRTAEVEDAEGVSQESGGGRQAVLMKWLGLTAEEVYEHLMRPAGYIHNPANQSWDNSPGISAEVIERARANGVLKEEGYRKIQEARGAVGPEAAVAGLVESFEAIRETDPGLFDSLMSGLESLMEDAKDFGRSVYEGIKDIGKWVFSRLPWNNARQETTVQGAQQNNQININDYWTVPNGSEAFYNSMGTNTTEVRWEYSNQNPDNNGYYQCNRFVKDMLLSKFGDNGQTLHDLIYQGNGGDTNTLFEAFKTNDNLEWLNPADYSIKDIQDLVDEQNILVLMIYKNNNGSGHIAFVGNSNLTLSTDTEIAGYEGRIAKNRLSADELVVVQAGAHIGTASIRYATNGWFVDDKLNRNLIENSLYFYTVRKGQS